MAITLSHGGDTIFSSKSRSDEVLVGTKDGLAFLKRNGNGWTETHRALPDKHIHAVIVEPESGAIIVGATHDTVYVSEDGGQTWERRDDGITEHDVYSLAAKRVNGKVRIFAGTQPAHLFYSDDLGGHWAELPALRSVDTSKWHFPGPPHIAHTKHINFHPGDPDTLFIGIEVGGLQKSVDGGKTFETVPGMDDDVHRTVINPLNADRMYITGGDGLYVTSDGGDSWEHWATTDHELGGYPDLLVLHPRQPDLVFVAAAQHGPGSWPQTHFAGTRISRSTDGGRTWEHLRNGLPDRMQSAVEAMSLEDWGIRSRSLPRPPPARSGAAKTAATVGRRSSATCRPYQRAIITPFLRRRSQCRDNLFPGHCHPLADPFGAETSEGVVVATTTTIPS